MLIWRAGRTQGDIAAELNIEPTAFGKKLRGKNGWALQELIDLAAALNTTVTYLIDEHGEEPTDDGPVGPAGIEPTTSTVESHRLAPVIPLFGKAA